MFVGRRSRLTLRHGEVGIALDVRRNLYFDGARVVEKCHVFVNQEMLVYLLKSKIHRARITGASLDYEGSLTIAEDLMERAGLSPYERILCSNLANGARFETYVIKGRRGSGAIELNGAAAHCGKIGHKLTIMAFSEVHASKARKWKPRVIVLGNGNKIKSVKGI